MTSYTRKLYARDPAAAEAFNRQQQFEHRITYGKHTQLVGFGFKDGLDASGRLRITDPTAGRNQFGERVAMPRQFACSHNCGSPACTKGCTLISRKTRS
jgi:hypothetical protein